MYTVSLSCLRSLLSTINMRHNLLFLNLFQCHSVFEFGRLNMAEDDINIIINMISLLLCQYYAFYTNNMQFTNTL